MRHVVWDWNGTLLSDQDVVVEALNVTLGEFDLPELTPERYRALYCRPVQRFYERVFGRSLTPSEWDRLDDTFHSAYDAALERARLADDAVSALTRVAESRRTQSLLSMYRHEQLLPIVRRHDLHAHFVRIDGLVGVGGGKKARHLSRHLDAVADVAGEDPTRVLVVGDAIDDAEAAAAVGARCILYDGGSHPREALERTGVPVVDSLTGALDLAGID